MSESFILSFFAITVGIPMVCIAWIGIQKERIKLRKLELEALSSEKAAHTAQLEDRVRVLERLATDKGLVLSDEIEKLRDAPALLRAD